MIVHSEYIEGLNCDRIYQYLRSITAEPYRKFTAGYTHSYKLQNLPNIQLMEGVVVPPHSDKIEGYRPILMLHNPGSNYIIRGLKPTATEGIWEHQAVSAQKKGTLIVLDIDAEHQVHNKDPNGGFGAWAGLVVVGDGEGGAFMKDEWNSEQVLKKALQDLKWLLQEFENQAQTVFSYSAGSLAP